MATDTKSSILAGTLALFNERGAGSVTTNHVADALGMSPGNLYYHYRNKEEIVRALFGQLRAAWAELYQLPADRMPGVDDMESMFVGNFDIQQRFLFFFRELPSLLQADPILAAEYREARSSGFEGFRQLLCAFVAAGALRNADNETIDDIANLLWLVGDFWAVFVELGGAPFDDRRKAQGVRLFRHIMKPLGGDGQ